MNISINNKSIPTPQDSLGKYAKLRTPSGFYVDTSTGESWSDSVSNDEKRLDARRLRFSLQDQAREILYNYHTGIVPKDSKGREKHHRTCSCNRSIVAPTVQVVKSQNHSKSFFTGVATCANSRTCPVCSAVINERKSNEMRDAMAKREQLGLHFSLITLTAPHSAGDSIYNLVPMMNDAHSRFWRGNPAKRFKDKYGILGHIRSFEITYGKNGWHPHFHLIVVSKRPLPTTQKKGFKPTIQQTDEYNWILNRWQNSAMRSGLSSPNEYGLDIQDGSKAGEYITKFGSDGELLKTHSGNYVTWDMADELSKANSKKGKGDSLSPFELLEQYKLTTGDEKHKYKQLYLDYSRAMTGVTLLKWSRGLRDVFDLGQELTDEEIINETQDQSDLVAHVTPFEWKVILKKRLRTTLIELADNGGAVAVARFLFDLTAKGSFSDYLYQFRLRSKTFNTSLDIDMDRISVRGQSISIDKITY
jgi:hypothetical protein